MDYFPNIIIPLFGLSRYLPKSHPLFRTIPLNTWRNNNVVITSKRRHFDVITSKWRRVDVITTLLLPHVFSGMMSEERQRTLHHKQIKKHIKVSCFIVRTISINELPPSGARPLADACNDDQNLAPNIHYRQKNMEYFLFHRFFALLWGVQGVSVLETHSCEQILLLEWLIST